MKKPHTLARNVPHTNIYLYNTYGGTKLASVCRYIHMHTQCTIVPGSPFVTYILYCYVVILLLLLLSSFYYYYYYYFFLPSLLYVSSPPYTSTVFHVDPNLLSLCCCPYNIIYVQNHHAHATESRCCFVV